MPFGIFDCCPCVAVFPFSALKTSASEGNNANETLSKTWVGVVGSAGVTSANSPVTYGYNEYNPLLLETVSTPQNTYTFLFNDFGKVTQLKAGNTALVSYTYQQNYGKLASMTYANGYSEQYSYNNLGLLSALYKNNSAVPSYRYYYDANGNLTEKCESSTGNSTIYHYDTLSRLIKIELYEEEYGTYPLYTEINYDNENRVSSIYYNFEYDTLYGIATYGASDRLEKWDTYGLTRYYSYDYLQRINSVATKDVYGSTLFNTNYTFLSGWNSSAYTTTMVETEQNTALNETLKYVYDSAGRVTQVLRNNTLVYKYTYDETTGFLVREDNADAGKSYVYAYDEMGNILNRYAYAFTTGTLGSLTGTKTWYNGTSSTFGKICYGIDGQDDLWIDSFGNPYYNNETCEYFTWQGRELTYYDNSMDQYYYYTYNSDGIRTGKRMEEYAETKETVTYYLDGTQIIREIRYHVDDGTKDIFYYYDENGAPVGMSYGGPTYTYYKNIFGDILGIFDENGTLVVRYYYDAWGNIISTTGSMASTLGRDNPFRYRGYYYDTETGFYYLNARYYNPELGRFISADPVLDTNSAVGCNMFAYCGNDPVNKIDPTGCIVIADDLVIYVGAALILILVAAMIPPAEPITWDFPDIGSRKQSISAAAKEYVQKQEKARSIVKDLAPPLPKQKKDPVHHIVAKGDWRAEESRSILRGVGIEPCTDPQNLIVLPQAFHASLHTTAYHNYVTERLRRVAGNRVGVEATLAELKIEIIMHSIAGTRWE